MEWMYANVRYWLVEHPTVTEFEWKEGQTWGASTQFLAITFITYLSLTALLINSHKISILSASSLHFISAVHNFILLILSSIMALGGALSVANEMPNYRWLFCLPPNNNSSRRGPIFFWAYMFYLSKLLEFVDTLLIILNGEGRRRLTFLHVYHHAVVVVMCYVWLHTSQSLFPLGVVTNSCVHILMYAYYMMCSLGRRPAWKRRVTDFQITQFLFGLVVSGVMLWLHFDKKGKGCSGIWGWVLNFVFGCSLLGMFIDFHIKNYAKKNK